MPVTSRSVRVGLAGVISLVSAAIARGQDASPSIATFLETSIGLSENELRAVERGEVVTHVLPTTLKRDIAVFGILMIDAPREVVAAYLANTAAVLAVPGRAAFGIARDTMLPADLADLTFTARDVAALAKCGATSCAFKLSSADMTRLSEVAGDSDGPAKVGRLEQERLAALANAYRQHGNEAMPTYDDAPTSIHGREAFAAMHAEIRVLDHYAPGLREYLDDYPRRQIAGASDVVYWAKDELPGLRLTTTLNHRVFHSTAGATGTTIEATKLIVANHYLEAALEVIAVVDRPGTGGHGVYLLLLRQYRLDRMPSILGVSLRGRATSKLRDHAEEDMLHIKERVTSPAGR